MRTTSMHCDQRFIVSAEGPVAASTAEDPHRFRDITASSIIRIAAGWIALGGLGKLILGAPSDLPFLAQALVPDPATSFSIVVGVELFAAALAMMSPRAAWRLVTVLLAVFCVLSGYDALRGVDDCGCLGGAISVPPAIVVLIDATLLIAILVLRPRNEQPPRRSRAPSAGPVIAALALSILTTTSASKFPLIASAHPNDAGDPRLAHRQQPRTNDSVTTGEPAEGAWEEPSEFPPFVVLDPESWVGQPLSKTELARWVDVSTLPSDAAIIFYMDTCPRCRDLLSERAHSPGDLPFVLIRLPASPTFPTCVKDDVPAGLRIDLPRMTRWSMVVPWEVIVRDRTVERATSYHRQRANR